MSVSAFRQESHVNVWYDDEKIGSGYTDTIVTEESELWLMSLRMVTTLYSDGGVFRPRRCEAGSWAWVGVDSEGTRVAYQTGWLSQRGVLDGGVTNSISEFAAMLRALEVIGRAVPGWCGRMASDSEVTIGRFRSGWRLSGIPRGWETRMLHALDRVGDVEYVLVKGHPNRAEILTGVGTRARSGRSYPVSEHQVFCDDLCTRMLDEWGKAHGVAR